MRKSITMIFVLVLFALCFMLPITVYASEEIKETGEWNVTYDIDDSLVTRAGGNAVISVNVENLSTSKYIYYVSIDIGAGSASHFYQIDPVIDLGPGLTATLRYTVPIAASEVDRTMNMWISMSQGTSSETDGIGLAQVKIGEPARYSADISFRLDREIADPGDNMAAIIRILNNGNERARFVVYDIYDTVVFDDTMSYGMGYEEYHYNVVHETRNFQYRVKVYEVGGSVVKNEFITPIRSVTVRTAATPAPTEPTTPTPLESITPTPLESAEPATQDTPTDAPEDEKHAAAMAAQEGVDAGTSQTQDKNKFIYIIIGVLFLITCTVVIAMVVVLRGRKK